VIIRATLNKGPNICGSERQYIYRLRKWGVKKFGPVNNGAASARGRDQGVETVTKNPGFSHNGLPVAPKARDLSKRPRSLCSISSAGSKISRPPEKRGKAMLSADPDSVVSDLSPGPGPEYPIIGLVSDGSNQFHTSQNSIEATFTLEDSSSSIKTPLSHLFPFASLSPSVAGTLLGVTSGGATELEDLLEDISPVRPVRELNCNSPVDAFSKADLLILKRAADYMAVLGYSEEAFELYTLLLKRYQLDLPKNYPPGSCIPFLTDLETEYAKGYWHLVTQCVDTAQRTEHTLIVENLSRAQISKDFLLSDRNIFYSFLVLMLLATCSRTTRPAEMKAYLSRATKYYPQLNSRVWEVALDAAGGSLDLVFFQNLGRLPGSCDLTKAAKFSFRSSAAPYLNRHSSSDVALEEVLVRRIPGPFEVGEDNRMGNPCVRSCLRWCAVHLCHLEQPQPWWPINVHGSHEVGIATSWMAVHGVFVALWRCWSTTSSKLHHEWMWQTEKRMGISACELLFLVCRCIYEAAQPQSVENSWLTPELQTVFWNAAEKLLCEDDYNLAHAVLKQYIWKHTVRVSPEWLLAAQQAAKPAALTCIEHTLRVRFWDHDPVQPPSTGPTFDYQGGSHSPPRNPDTATLLSSLGSTSASFGSFRRSKLAVENRLSSLRGRKSGSNPGNAVERSSGGGGSSNRSSSEMSDLSDRFSRSLRILGSGTSRLSSIRETIPDEKESCSSIAG